MRTELLIGKRYINFVRCSTDQQTETSIPAQLELLNKFAKTIGMIHVDDIVLDGVSGSKPGNRDDIRQIITRKETKNDFDVLLVQTEDRLTRGGAEHGMWIQGEFNLRSIQIVYACSDAPDGPYANIIRVMKHDAAQQTAISTSLRSTQGYQRALENRNVATSTHSPYGTHRLYCSADDKPLFIIRDNRVRREKALVFSGRQTRPANWSFQPVAIGTATEATKLSKLSMERSR